jgi:signal transduction histidine kinase
MVYSLFVLVSGLLLANIFLMYKNNQVIEVNKGLQEEAERIKVNTLDIIRTIHQVDMGARGYALIDSKLQRGVTIEGFVKMDGIFQTLAQSLAEQNFPMTSFQTMKDSIGLYLNTVREMIVLVDEGRKEAFNEKLRVDLGHYAYLSYARFAEHVNKFENSIANDASHRYRLALRNGYLLQIVLFLIMVPSLIYMMFLFNKTISISTALAAARQDTADVLAGQKVALERLVHERTNEILAQNEEISAQYEEITTHNEQLQLHQREIERQRSELEERTSRLTEAYETIERQHLIIQERNKELSDEISEQNRDLRKANLELIEQNSKLEQFGYIISHNFRGPMARIIGLSHLLKTQVNEQDRANIIDLMVKSTNDFDSVFKDLSLILSIQKLNTDVFMRIALDDVMEKVIGMLESEITATEAEVLFDFTQAPVIISLPKYIESIFFNLVSNAIKFRHPDRKPMVIIKSSVVGSQIFVSVTDNALGIDLERYGNAVFNLYKRFHFHVEGKGLGLYLVRTQVEALGGKIWIDSKPETGSVFRIEFVAESS